MKDKRATNQRIGHLLNHGQILNLLGAGVLHEVYLAEDAPFDCRQAALKILCGNPADCANNRMRRFVQQAKSALALNRPNIFTIYEIGEFDKIKIDL